MVYFSSDLHLGHRNINKYREAFSSSKEHDEFILEKMKKLTKRDILFMLGDFIFPGELFKQQMEIISRLPCRIKVVLGNHDSMELLDYRSNQISIENPLRGYKNLWLSHCPIHHLELRGRLGNIHGHLHQEKLEDLRYFNVNLDVNNYEFVPFDTIKEHFNKLKEINEPNK